jgi:hypothetical protein
MDDEEIGTLVNRLARRHKSGGKVIERAAIVASGGDAAAIVAWIMSHDGAAETVVAAAPSGGMHGLGPKSHDEPPPRRYVLPAGVLG